MVTDRDSNSNSFMLTVYFKVIEITYQDVQKYLGSSKTIDSGTLKLVDNEGSQGDCPDCPLVSSKKTRYAIEIYQLKLAS